MLDHIGISVTDLKRALAFYDRALAPLGIGRVMSFPDEGEPQGLGCGAGRKPFFWVSAHGPASGPIRLPRRRPFRRRPR